MPRFSAQGHAEPRPSFHFHQIRLRNIWKMSKTDQNAADPFELPEAATWAESVRLFQAEAAEWLTAADAPQLMALRTIAAQLDGGTFQAALISQFTLIHRALLNRRPGEPAPDPEAPKRAALGPSLFEQLGGAWTADA